MLIKIHIEYKYIICVACTFHLLGINSQHEVEKTPSEIYA